MFLKSIYFLWVIVDFIIICYGFSRDFVLFFFFICISCDFKTHKKYNLKVHIARKHVALEDDQEKKGEIDVVNGEGMKQD